MNILVIAKDKGYYVDKIGNVYSKKQKLSPNNTNGKLSFRIRYKTKLYNIPVHRLLAYIKYGDKLFTPGLEVRHLNNNALDNSWDNIVLGTHKENMLDIPKIQRINTAINAAKKLRRFSDIEVKQIVKDRGEGMTYKQLCLKYNAIKSTLSYFFNQAYYK